MAEASCQLHMGSSSQYPSSMGLERGHRSKRAPGVPERGSTDPREGKGHTCLAKLLSKSVLSVSLSLSLILAFLGKCWCQEFVMEFGSRKDCPPISCLYQPFPLGVHHCPLTPNLLGSF